MAESIRTVLLAELDAIKARLSKAGTAEAKQLAVQFGERIEHLGERIKALGEPEAPPPAATPAAK